VAGEHFVEWTDLQDLKRKCRKWLNDDRAKDRRRIAETGKAFVRQHYSYEAQVRKLFDDLLARVA
jgi:spore maturation protein CgeB